MSNDNLHNHGTTQTKHFFTAQLTVGAADGQQRSHLFIRIVHQPVFGRRRADMRPGQHRRAKGCLLPCAQQRPAGQRPYLPKASRALRGFRALSPPPPSLPPQPASPTGSYCIPRSRPGSQLAALRKSVFLVLATCRPSARVLSCRVQSCLVPCPGVN